MKILYLTDLLSPYRTAWMNLLSKEYEVDAYYFDAAEKTREEKWLNSIRNEFRTFPVKNKTLFGVRFSHEAAKLLKNSDYDIYIIDGYSSLVQVLAIKRLAKRGKNVFVNVDGIDIWRREGIPSKLKWLVKSRLYRSGAKFLCGSKIAAERMIQLGAKPENVFKHPFTTIYRADIISADEKIKLQKKYKKEIGAEGKKVALAVGRFIPLKRYEDLIQAWRGAGPDRILYIIGSGELKDRYLELIKDLAVENIVIVDHLGREELDKYYTAADLFIHTSSTEVWGLIFNEAMSKGCPVISTNHCVGAVELIEDGKEGYLIDVGDVEALGRRITEVLGDDDLRHSMMQNSLAKISDYTYESMAQTHIKVFNGSPGAPRIAPRKSPVKTFKRYFFAVFQRLVAAYYMLHRGETSVLMFHRVAPDVGSDDKLNIKTETFLKFIGALKDSGAEFSPVSDIFKGGKKVIVSFDDVYYDSVVNAIPRLESNNIPYVLFVSPELIDKSGYITSAQLRELAKSKLCTVGFHSNSHIFLRELIDAQVAYETDCGKFEEEYDLKCDYFAYPYGSSLACSLRNIRTLKKSKYKAAFGTVSAKTNHRINKKHPYFLPRIAVSEKTWRKTLQKNSRGV